MDPEVFGGGSPLNEKTPGQLNEKKKQNKKKLKKRTPKT